MKPPTHILEYSNEDLWKAIQRRDYCYDDSFVFGVRSTKIYCRPSCPAITPRRRQVVFFLTRYAAEQAGFRPCKRCRPNDENFITLQRKRIEETCAYINRNMGSKLDLSELGRHVHLSPLYLQRLFKQIVGISPREYTEASRLRRVKTSMRNGESVRRANYSSGRYSTSWLYTNPFAKLGMQPSAYRKKGEGTRIYYSIHDCRLGKLLVAGTEKGICAVSMGDSDKMLEASLMSEYCFARLERKRDAGKLGIWINKILASLDGTQVVHLQDLPLDVQATSFQYKVWKELQSIPYGRTSSYSVIAKKVSSPDSCRAVANACAMNRVPLVIPCHRVVRKDGDLGGYRWGCERKASILQHEEQTLSNSNRQEL